MIVKKGAHTESMNKQKIELFAFATFLPLPTFASGGDAFEWLFIELFVIVAFTIIVILIKLNWKGRTLMILIFVATEYLMFRVADGIRYSQNRVMINVFSILAPMWSTIISYLSLKAKFKAKAS